jgi:hypothetical protein
MQNLNNGTTCDLSVLHRVFSLTFHRLIPLIDEIFRRHVDRPVPRSRLYIDVKVLISQHLRIKLRKIEECENLRIFFVLFKSFHSVTYFYRCEEVKNCAQYSAILKKWMRQEKIQKSIWYLMEFIRHDGYYCC